MTSKHSLIGINHNPFFVNAAQHSQFLGTYSSVIVPDEIAYFFDEAYDYHSLRCGRAHSCLAACARRLLLHSLLFWIPTHVQLLIQQGN
jgi:hypothetical protein